MAISFERKPLLDQSNLEGAVLIDLEDVNTPLPWRMLSGLLVLHFLQPLAYDLVYPFMNQMLLELNIATDPEQVGWYSGTMGSTASIANLVTVLPIAYAFDRYGAKRVLLMGTASLAFSLVAFGMSRTYACLIVVRCFAAIADVSGGLPSIIDSLVARFTDHSNQSTAFSVISIAYRMGQMFGSHLGGRLAHPERLWPHLFSYPFWLNYPFLLPCLSGAVAICIGVGVGAILLNDVPNTRPDSTSNVKTNLLPGTDIPRDQPQIGDSPVSVSMSNLLRNKEVIPIFLSLFGMSLTSELLFCVFPFFAFTPISSGGLGLGEAEIGFYLSVRAMINVLAVILFTPLRHWMGLSSTTRVYQYSMMFWPISVCFCPLLSAIARIHGVRGRIFNVAAISHYVIWSFAGYSWICSSILAVEFSPSPSTLARMNAIIYMSFSISSVIAPIFSNSLLAYSIEHQVLWGQLVWIVLFVIVVFDPNFPACLSSVHSLSIRGARAGVIPP